MAADGKRGRKRMSRSRGEGLKAKEREDAIMALIRAVPEGFVTTYGDLCPQAPRLPGRILATTTEVLPWHRIVRADGTFAKGDRQRRLLRREGVPFVGKRVDMERAHIPREALLDRV